ncbi:MAG: hypothetical protein R6V57_19050 [Vicinamibacterales bacterium]
MARTKTADRLVMMAAGLPLSLLWSAWIVAGTLLEERDLVADFGDVYRRYQRQVPMLFPWRGPVRRQSGA